MNDQLPPRLMTALAQLKALNELGITLLPVRHHSPACAYTLKHYIQQLKPTHILIEAPHSFSFLLEGLLDADTHPPIAIFAQSQKQSVATTKPDDEDIPPPIPEIFSAYYPFCDYSPEWVALKQGHAQKAKLEFIDLSWQEQSILKTDNPHFDCYL